MTEKTEDLPTPATQVKRALDQARRRAAKAELLSVLAVGMTNKGEMYWIAAGDMSNVVFHLGAVELMKDNLLEHVRD